MVRSALLVTLLFSVPAAWAGAPLSGDQIRKLAIGNTVVTHSIARNTHFRIFYAPDGAALSRNDDDGKTRKGSWRITEAGEWCNTWPVRDGTEERCGPVFDNGDGTYNRHEKGSLRSVWKKIEPGNTLAR